MYSSKRRATVLKTKVMGLDLSKTQMRGDSTWDDSSDVQPCPSCGVNQAVDCGFLVLDYWGEADCTHPEYTVCDSCPELKCYACRDSLTHPQPK